MSEIDVNPNPKPKPKVKWYFTKKFLVLMVLTVGPFALPLLWFNPHYSVKSKVIWTILTGVICYALMLLSQWAFEQLKLMVGLS